MVGNSHKVPQFIKAANPNGLVRLMLSNNLKYGMQFNYHIVHDGKAWFAWFSVIQDVKEALTDALQSGSS